MLAKLLKAVKQATSFYRVIVMWEGRIFEHVALSFESAMTWARCYPRQATVAVWHTVRGLVSRRVPV